MSHFESAQENVSCQYVSFSIIILHEATPSSCRFWRTRPDIVKSCQPLPKKWCFSFFSFFSHSPAWRRRIGSMWIWVTCLC